MHKLALIALGGMLGTLCRYVLSTWIDEKTHSQFPYGTAVINLTGCLLAGFLFQLFEQISVPAELRLAVFTGFLGGYTTFSAYGLQSVLLLNDGMLSMAVVNVLLSNVAGLAMVGVGRGLSRALL